MKQRHTSYGGRADAAPDSKVDLVKPRSAQAERAKRYRDRKKLPSRLVTEAVTRPSQNVTPNVTVRHAENVTPVTPSAVTRLEGLVKSLETRISSMERWAEQLEERFPRMRVAATPLQGTATGVPASPQARVPRHWPGTWRVVPPGARPGDTFTTSKGQSLTVPEVDGDGHEIPD